MPRRPTPDAPDRHGPTTAAAGPPPHPHRRADGAHRDRWLDTPGRPVIDVAATPCRHGPPLSRRIAGDVIGFTLRWSGQERGALWVSGDTVEVCRLLGPRTAIPVHCEGWTHFRHGRDAITRAFADAPEVSTPTWLPIGRRVRVAT
jgi:hypothetical protein